MIKYRLQFDQIEAREVVRETKAQVELPNGRKEAKRTDWQTWHDTWEDAHAHLLAKAQREVDLLRLRLEQAKGKLGNIKGMKPSSS